MKKTIKVSGSESGFKVVALNKKKKEGVLAESNTTESESIDMEEECLVEETSVDYGESGAFMEEDPNQMPKSLHVKTKKVLEKPLGVIDYGTVNTDDDVLDDFFLLSPPLPIKLSMQVPVRKFFALNIDLVTVIGKSSQEKLSFIRKIFSSVNGFGRASTSSKFGRIIYATFTSEKAMIAAEKLANDCGIVVNTNLKRPGNIHTNRDIVLKKISVGTLIEAVCTAVSEFGIIKKIRMQLVELWQKAIVEMKNQNQADLLSILIEKDAVCVARADVDKQTWNSRDRFRALLYTLPVDFLDLVGEKTCIIDRNPVDYTCDTALLWSCLSTVLCFSCNSLGHTSLVCKLNGESLGPKSKRTPLSAQDQFRLTKIYEKKSAPVSHPMAFGGKIWALVVGSPSSNTSCGYDSQLGSIGIGKPLPPVVNNLEKQLVTIKNSLVSFTEQIGKLAKKLDSFTLAVSQPSPGCQLPVIFPSQDQVGDIIMRESSGEATYGKTAMLVDLSVSSQVIKLETMLEGLSASVLSLSAHFDGLVLADSRYEQSCQTERYCLITQRYEQFDFDFYGDEFDGVHMFSSGLNSGYVGAGITIVLNSSLVKHVCKVSKVPAGEINFLIAKAVNESSFVVLGGDFNKNGSHRCASFRKCFELGLVNFLCRSSFVKTLTWCNSCGVNKTIDYVFISFNLVGVVVDCSIASVEDFFNTNHRAVSVFVGLNGLLDVWLNLKRKQANKDHWKYDIKNVNEFKWSEFGEATAVNTCIFSDAFVVAKWYLDLDAIFHKLELLVSKLVKASHLVSGEDFAFLLDTWDRLDSVGASSVKSLFFAGSGFDAVYSELAKTRKFYCSVKLRESKHAKASHIRQAIERRMESFEVDKGHTIWSVLERPFWKVVLDYLIVGEDLVLEPELVKSKMDVIMESWTQKCVVVPDISSNWK
ncbi:hypothetical protein G9A89_002601 [Geosiphon pyriformis]|nr:hypothetical protein G9A89_002601 [Geosiphon pyriformis]